MPFQLGLNLLKTDTLDTNDNNECCFQEFSKALEPFIADYEKNGFHMDVSRHVQYIFFSHHECNTSSEQL